MRLKFRINYHTVWGQNMYVLGSCKELGGDNSTQAFPLNYTENGNWEGSIEIDTKSTKKISYKYLIKNGSEENIHLEWGTRRLLELSKNYSHLILEDVWRPNKDIENALLSQAFAGNLFGRKNPKAKKSSAGPNCRLQLIAPRIRNDQSFCVVGSSKTLGSWNPDKAVVMQDKNFPVWQVDLKLNKNEQDFEYKYGIYDHEKKKLVEWELGENRCLKNRDDENNQFFIKTDLKFRYPF